MSAAPTGTASTATTTPVTDTAVTTDSTDIAAEDQLAHALRLLPGISHGRAAVTRHAMPYILPACHVVTGEQILLRIPTGQVDARLIDGTVLAYEANSYGCAEAVRAAGATPRDMPLWAAQLIGTARSVVPSAAEQAAFRPFPALAVDHGVAGGGGAGGPLYVRVSPRFAVVRRPVATRPAS